MYLKDAAGKKYTSAFFNSMHFLLAHSDCLQVKLAWKHSVLVITAAETFNSTLTAYQRKELQVPKS